MWLYWIWNSQKSIGQNLVFAARVVVPGLLAILPGLVMYDIGAPVVVTVLVFGLGLVPSWWWVSRQYSSHMGWGPTEERDRG